MTDACVYTREVFTMQSSDPTRTPVRLEPALVLRPWGGRRLVDLPRVAAPPDGPVGEAWLAGPDTRAEPASDDRDAAASAATTLGDLAGALGEAFVGSAPHARYGKRMPLLAKLLDAVETLSVQVHPDDAYALSAERASGHLGKTEAWLILEAAAGASVAWGWRRTVTRDEVRDAVAAGALETLLRHVPVAPGDVVVNEAGVVHAVGPGIVLYELQQASDLTYRLYDFDRRDAAGRSRELHVDKALDVARLMPAERPGAPQPLAPGRLRLATTDAFRLERWTLGRDAAPSEHAWQVEPRSLELWTVVDGAATLAWDGGSCALERFESVALPARLGPARWRGDAVLVRGTA